MSFKPISGKIENEGYTTRDISSWVTAYKEGFVQHPHDNSQLTLLLPDDCLVVAGPTRLRHASNTSDSSVSAVANAISTAVNSANGSSSAGDFFPIGFANSVTHTETRQVQPLKAIGSRRHIFAATNSPVQIQIARLMLLGTNVLRSLYGYSEKDLRNVNSKYSGAGEDNYNSDWFSNLEEDLYRIPIGIGIIYNAPANLIGLKSNVAGAEYFEVCTIQSKNVSIQSGQAMIMEQVTLFADRCIPWNTIGKGLTLADHKNQSVSAKATNTSSSGGLSSSSKKVTNYNNSGTVI